MKRFHDGRNEVFYTAGYDGRILLHAPAGPVDSNTIWGQTPVADLSPHIVRSISVWTLGGILQGIYAGGESGNVYFVSPNQQVPPKVVTGISGKIFSIAIDPSGDLVAVGDAEGLISIGRIARQDPTRFDRIDQFQMPCFDIIRGLQFITDDQLFAVSWAGCVRLRSVSGQSFIFSSDVDPQLQNPTLDRNKLQFGDDNEIDKTTGLSPAIRNYFRRLQ